MSSDTVIDVDRVSKCYRIYSRPQDRLKQAVIPRLRRALGPLAGQADHAYFREFWAMRDVSLSIRKGETIGIIGRNGAGKSTLLQMIAGTLTPTEGSVTVRGRVAALLELGAGFNPEFSGRENIFMNAALMGLSRAETEERLDRIVEFADIGDFVEQPVKTYSSGMFARLAFAVAINVSPDVLIVDEALSVGDSGFQLKCMLKMRELQAQGVTILFVSHDMQSIVRFCDSAIVLHGGRIHYQSRDVLQAVKEYEKLTRATAIVAEPKPAARPAERPVDTHYHDELGGIKEERFGSGLAKYMSVELVSASGESTNQFSPGERVEIKATVWSETAIADVAAGFSLRDKQGTDITGDNSIYAGVPITLPAGLSVLTFTFTLGIAPGDYFLYLGLASLGENRTELDQRWPVRKLTVLGTRKVVGSAFCPAEIQLA